MVTQMFYMRSGHFSTSLAMTKYGHVLALLQIPILASDDVHNIIEFLSKKHQGVINNLIKIQKSMYFHGNVTQLHKEFDFTY